MPILPRHIYTLYLRVQINHIYRCLFTYIYTAVNSNSARDECGQQRRKLSGAKLQGSWRRGTDPALKVCQDMWDFLLQASLTIPNNSLLFSSWKREVCSPECNTYSKYESPMRWLLMVFCSVWSGRCWFCDGVLTTNTSPFFGVLFIGSLEGGGLTRCSGQVVLGGRSGYL